MLNYYICRMIQKAILIFVIFSSIHGLCWSQPFIRTADLFRSTDERNWSGELNIIQDPAIDTLISRYILYNKREGMQGFRIQIYKSSVRNARDLSARARAEFINKFPDIVAYSEFQEPGYYLVRAGDFRTKTEAYKYLLMVRKAFPNAYLVPAKINFPDLTKN